MKTLLFIISLALLFISACIEQVEKPEPKQIDKTGAFYINKNNTTYEIYSNLGELIAEYTPLNTDSASLETLEDLYQNVKYFYNREEMQEPEKKIEGTKNI